jgi:hypothetical protein
VCVAINRGDTEVRLPYLFLPPFCQPGLMSLLLLHVACDEMRRRRGASTPISSASLAPGWCLFAAVAGSMWAIAPSTSSYQDTVPSDKMSRAALCTELVLVQCGVQPGAWCPRCDMVP